MLQHRSRKHSKQNAPPPRANARETTARRPSIRVCLPWRLSRSRTPAKHSEDLQTRQDYGQHNTTCRPKRETTYGFSRYKKSAGLPMRGPALWFNSGALCRYHGPPESCRVTRSKTGYNVCFSCVCCQGPGGGPAPNSLFRVGTVRVWQGVVYNKIARAVKSRCTEYAQKFYPGARLHSPPLHVATASLRARSAEL